MDFLAARMHGTIDFLVEAENGYRRNRELIPAKQMKMQYRIRISLLILIACLFFGSVVLLPGTSNVYGQITRSNGLDYSGISLLDSTDIEEDDILSTRSSFPHRNMVMAGSTAPNLGFTQFNCSPQTPPPKFH